VACGTADDADVVIASGPLINQEVQYVNELDFAKAQVAVLVGKTSSDGPILSIYWSNSEHLRCYLFFFILQN
jgi:hypothetical protein